MQKMTKTYKETLAVIETQLIYIETHLRNIDAHLERLNNQEDRQNATIAKNSIHIGLMWKIGGGLLALLGSGIAILLKALGVY